MHVLFFFSFVSFLLIFLQFSVNKVTIVYDIRQYVTLEKGIMILSAGEHSDGLVEINRTIIAGRQLAGNVKIIAFDIGSGMLPLFVKSKN